jgi:ABC-2 type transport system permease protein
MRTGIRTLHYSRLLGAQLRLSALLSLQYRADFVSDGFISAFWLLFNALPLWVAFSTRSEIAGWTFSESLVVLGLFTVLKGVMDGAINPSLTAVVEQVRRGTLDFTLLKPADAQFLVSTARFQPWKAMDVLAGLALVVGALIRLHRMPSPIEWLVVLGLLGAALAVLYSLWILTVCATFFVVRLDNLAYLFASLFDLARWPVSVFHGLYRVLFTFVLPLAIMTTYPAMALLGRLSGATVAWALGGTLGFSLLSRWTWRRSIREYTSASS